MHPMNVPTKLEVRSFNCSWVNRGYPNIGAVPGYAHTSGGRRGLGMVPFERSLVSSYRPSIVTFPLPLRVSEVLSLLFSRAPLFLYPTSIVSPKFTHVLLGVGGWSLGYQLKSEDVELIVRAISFQDFQPMRSQITNVTDGQTDRRTDRRTTCDRKTALCTKVLCAVKIFLLRSLLEHVLHILWDVYGLRCLSAFYSWKCYSQKLLYIYSVTVMPNTHRRRRRDETVLSRRRRRCEHNSQLAHDDCRRIRSTIWKLTKPTLSIKIHVVKQVFDYVNFDRYW